MPFGLGFFATAGAGAGGAGAMELIATQVLSSGASTVTFNSIPQGFKHLQIRAVNKLDTFDLPTFNGSLMGINGNTSFSNHILFGNGSSVSRGVLNGNSFIYAIPTDANGTSTFAAQVIDILDYAVTTKNKTIRMLNGHIGTSDQHIGLQGMAYLSTTAVTSLSFTGASGYNWKAGSRWSLYGIKG